MKLLRSVQIIGVILIAFGLCGVTPTLFYRYKLANANAVPTVPAVSITKSSQLPSLVTGNPVSISVPSVNIDIPVINGTYNTKTKQWTLTTDKAQFATISSTPNNIAGVTYIYGHSLPKVFARLNNVAPGSEAHVLTDNGYRFTYQFQETHTTTPADSSIFGYTGKPILTLQTCSGAWFQNRQQFTFSFIKYEKQTYSHPKTK